MGIDGVWKIEMLGPYGWEAVATAFFEDGTYRAASVDHFTIGTYTLEEKQLTITGQATVHGRNRTFFGHSGDTFDLNVEGTVDGDTILATTTDKTQKFSIPLRATRLGSSD